jgi:hypothetical protein
LKTFEKENKMSKDACEILMNEVIMEKKKNTKSI